MEPTMIYYDPAKSDVNLAIGKDACYYHPDCPYVMWNGEEQPYGYAGGEDFIRTITGGSIVRGLRKYLTPFAPDQSGAVSVLYELGD